MKQMILYLCITVGILSCQSEYDQYVKREMNSGVHHESLMFGLSFGQTKKEFYDTCWLLNKEQKLSQGPKNQYAMYIIEPHTINGEEDKIEMLFYGIFDDDKILRGMDFQFSYPKWAVWNDDYHADELMTSLQQYYADLFPGNDFIQVSLGQHDLYSYIKIDGNRQILMYPKDTKDVVVKIEDLRYKLSSKASS